VDTPLEKLNNQPHFSGLFPVVTVGSKFNVPRVEIFILPEWNSKVRSSCQSKQGLVYFIGELPKWKHKMEKLSRVVIIYVLHLSGYCAFFLFFFFSFEWTFRFVPI
jgi:hypothetical protein